MTFLRSLLFSFCFYIWSVLVVVLGIPLLVGPPKWARWVQTAWSSGVIFFARTVVGIDYEIRGRENLPDGAVIVASKHQSAWETAMFPLILENPGIVAKKQLANIPIYGWYFRKTDMIPIDRKGHAAAMRAMLRAADRIKDLGRAILIFPEGTRAEPGQAGEYKVGAVGLYRHLKLPVVPVALNSGLFWPRKSFLKRPGKIVLEFLEPIETGLGRDEFTAALRAKIEEGTMRLLREGGFEGIGDLENTDATPET